MASSPAAASISPVQTRDGAARDVEEVEGEAGGVGEGVGEGAVKGDWKGSWTVMLLVLSSAAGGGHWRSG